MGNLNVKEQLKEDITKEGDKIRDGLLENLFTLNSIFSAAFLVLFQKDENYLNIKLLNILPFISVGLIMIYKLGLLRTMGHVYHNIDKWDKDKLSATEKMHNSVNQVIYITVFLTLIEMVYLFYLLTS